MMYSDQRVNMPRVFLCHSSADKFFVRELAERLEAAGVDVWLDEAEIEVGDSLTDRIGRAIEQTDFVAVVLSRHSIDSEWVKRELQVALQMEMRHRHAVVLPLLLEPIALPPFLQDKLYADFSTPELYEANFPKLLRAIGLRSARKRRKRQKRPLVTAADSALVSSQRRLAEFTDLTIVDLSEVRPKHPREGSLLRDVAFRLSATPPQEWSQIFDAERRFPRHTTWRRAWIEGPYVVIRCLPEEVGRDQLRELRENVSASNAKFRTYLVELSQQEIQTLVDQAAQKTELKVLRERLDFR